MLDELDGESVIRQHLKWIELEPLHPDRFVATPTPRIVSSFGQQKIEIPIQAKNSVEGDVAIPAEGVPVTLGGSAAFKGVDLVQGSGRLTRTRPINAKVDAPEEGVDAADARLFLDVSGYPRAFMWNVLAENGVIEPFRGERIAIRKPVAARPGEPTLSWLPNQPIDLEIEVDSDDKKCAVEFELRMLGDSESNFDTDQTTIVDQKKLRGIRQVVHRLQLDPKTGQLGVRCEVSDFRLALDPAGSQGRAEIVARIASGENEANALAEDRLQIVLDATPPEIGELATGYNLPLDHIAEKPLQFAVNVTDRLSGPSTLHYWVGAAPRRNEAGVWNPPGIEAKLEPVAGDNGFQDREFTITVEKVPEGDAGRLGTLRFFFIATDHAGNISEEPRPLEILYATQSMEEKGPGKGKPRDVIVTVNYRRGTNTAICRDAKVELMPPGGMAALQQGKGNTKGEVLLKDVKPGEYQLKATGTTNNTPGKGETALTVPDEGEGPLRATITLE